jgi:hypothetical protein
LSNDNYQRNSKTMFFKKENPINHIQAFLELPYEEKMNQIEDFEKSIEGKKKMLSDDMKGIADLKETCLREKLETHYFIQRMERKRRVTEEEKEFVVYLSYYKKYLENKLVEFDKTYDNINSLIKGFENQLAFFKTISRNDFVFAHNSNSIIKEKQKIHDAKSEMEILKKDLDK